MDDELAEDLYRTLEKSASNLSQYFTPRPCSRRINLNATQTLYRTCPRSSSPLDVSPTNSMDLTDLNLDSGKSSASACMDVNGNLDSESTQDSSSATLIQNKESAYDLHQLLDGLTQANNDLHHLEILEQQVLRIASSIETIKAKLVKQNIVSIKLVQRMLNTESKNQSSIAQNVETQTSTGNKLSSSLQSNWIIGDPVSQSLVDLDSSLLEPPNPITLNEKMKQKLHRLPALVRGYLVRRLLATERVTNLKRTIHDTSLILLNFKQTNLTKEGKLVVTHEDIVLHMRLCNQLEKACQEFYSIFIDLPMHKRMKIINLDRLHRIDLMERRSLASSCSNSLSSHNPSSKITKIHAHKSNKHS